LTVAWKAGSVDQNEGELASDPSLDVALLQEAKPPPADVNCEENVTRST
jgi:hypothetical protein